MRMRLSLVALFLVAGSASHPQMDAGADLATSGDLGGPDMSGVDLATVDLASGDLDGVCGNGILEAPEQCDNGAANGTVTSCATYDGTCPGCSATCTSQVFVGPYCGDGTCQTAHESSATCNADCHSVCGNGVIEEGETCDDGANNGHETCTTYNGACLICSSGCRASAVAGPHCGDGICQAGIETSATCAVDCYCGNGTIDAGELCDILGPNVGTETCAQALSIPGETGTLGCKLGCVAYDVSQCM